MRSVDGQNFGFTFVIVEDHRLPQSSMIDHFNLSPAEISVPFSKKGNKVKNYRRGAFRHKERSESKKGTNKMTIRLKKLLNARRQRRKQPVQDKHCDHSVNTDDCTNWTSNPSLNAPEEEERHELDRLADDDAAQQRADPEISHVNFRNCVVEMIGDPQERKVFFLTSEQKEELMSKINLDFFEILGEQAMMNQTVDVHLGAASRILDQFTSVQDIIFQTGMPGTTQDIIFDAMEECLLPRITYHYLPMSNVASDDAARIASWIDKFLNKLEATCPGLEANECWSRDRDNLIDHYIKNGVRYEMNELLSRTLYLQSEKDMREDSDGHLVTGLSEMVVFMFQQQVDMAHDQLPGTPVQLYQQDVHAMCDQELPECVHVAERVLAACNQELSRFVSDLQLKIATEWKEMGAGYLCAVINDVSRLSDQCEELSDTFVESGALKQQARETVRDLTELSLHATRFLCNRIMDDVRKSLTRVGNSDWESKQSRTPVETAIVTLKQAFADAKTWLVSTDLYLPKILKECLDMTVKTYLESYFVNTKVRGVEDPHAVAEQLREDCLRLTIFFNGTSCEEFHGFGGFYTQTEINDQLRVLKNVAAVVDPSVKPEDSKGDIKVLLSGIELEGDAQRPKGGSFRSLLEPARDKSDVIFHLVGLRKRHGPLESITWRRLVASAQKELEDDRSNDNCKVPTMGLSSVNLRNSCIF
jgi:polyhydroxyalkanoate synthesis regulator phasin